ncbi:hypothetical protein ANN_27923 [Periplaneta americana]|uniref:C2H2-type domain-containing protein n=1 Tax=Periplaneta americana TaxID=6978 RepID=A0ABQ8RVH6_PERAM|nr:hypothetical protein ANN_27923 [Periplaneta americana]
MVHFRCSIDDYRASSACDSAAQDEDKVVSVEKSDKLFTDEDNWKTQNQACSPACVISESGDTFNKCNVCGEVFANCQSLKSHFRTHKGDNALQLEECGMCFSDSTSLKEHAREHTSEKPFKCKVCGKCFSQSRYLTGHARQHTGAKPFKCDICGKCFSRSGHLKLHVRLHTGEKPFKCNLCEKSFSRSGNLKTHERQHTGEKPFKCEHCGKCFSQSAHLNLHIRHHIGDKPFKCNDCGRCFLESGQLKKHARVHSGEKPFKCEVCGKLFSHSGNFRMHARLHTGEKPFKCVVCGKCFSQSGHLNAHVRQHTGDKPFKCDVCGKRFSRLGDQKLHARLHTGEKPFKCNICGKGFPRSTNHVLTILSVVMDGIKREVEVDPLGAQSCDDADAEEDGDLALRPQTTLEPNYAFALDHPEPDTFPVVKQESEAYNSRLTSGDLSYLRGSVPQFPARLPNCVALQGAQQRINSGPFILPLYASLGAKPGPEVKYTHVEPSGDRDDLDALSPEAVRSRLTPALVGDFRVSRARSPAVLFSVEKGDPRGSGRGTILRHGSDVRLAIRCSETLLKAKLLGSYPIKVEQHCSLNTTRGVVHTDSLDGMSDEEIQLELAEQSVSKAYRLLRKRDGQTIPLSTAFLTFEKPVLPEYILVGYERVPVRVYVPNPMRCFRYQRIGHTQKRCTNNIISAKCGGADPGDSPYVGSEPCVNCFGITPLILKIARIIW